MPPIDQSSLIINILTLLLSAGLSAWIASVRIGEYKNKVDNNCTDISDLKKEGKEVRDKVIACETSLKEREPLGRRKSPVALTDRGTKVLNESGGKDFVDANFTELSSKVEAKEPKTSYDVQEAAKQVIDEVREDDRMNPLKEYLFKEGLEIGDLVFVLGTYLRDKILESKKWAMEDIDKYDPNQGTL